MDTTEEKCPSRKEMIRYRRRDEPANAPMPRAPRRIHPLSAANIAVGAAGRLAAPYLLSTGFGLFLIQCTSIGDGLRTAGFYYGAAFILGFIALFGWCLLGASVIGGFRTLPFARAAMAARARICRAWTEPPDRAKPQFLRRVYAVEFTAFDGVQRISDFEENAPANRDYRSGYVDVLYDARFPFRISHEERIPSDFNELPELKPVYPWRIVFNLLLLVAMVNGWTALLLFVVRGDRF